MFYIALNKAGILYGNVQEYISGKMPVVVATIEQYAPGLLDNIQSYVSTAWATIKTYSTEYYKYTVNYLSTKVFV